MIAIFLHMRMFSNRAAFDLGYGTNSTTAIASLTQPPYGRTKFITNDRIHIENILKT